MMPGPCPTANASLDGTPSEGVRQGDERPAPSSDARPPAGAALCWRVHLLRMHITRLPGVLMTGIVGAACVWLMFGAWLPALAALLLLAGSVSEYLFPIMYRLAADGVAHQSLTTRIALPWSAIRRCRMGRRGVLLTSLAAPSRLDAFRGVLLRFAPDGESGDRNSVLALLAVYAPHLLETPADAQRAAERQKPVERQAGQDGTEPAPAFLDRGRKRRPGRSVPPENGSAGVLPGDTGP